MTLDIAALRRATPASADFAYFNNASASLMPTGVLSAMTEHLEMEASRGAYQAAERAQERIETGYADAAALLGCSEAQIAFTSSNTQGWRTVVEAMQLQAGDVILTGESEWGGNYAALLHLAARTGCTVEVIPNTVAGTISLDALAARLDSSVRLICLTWVASGCGTVHPAARVGTLARAAGVTFILDGAQAVGQLPSDVNVLGCDALTHPGRKWLRGPRGSGILYLHPAFSEKYPPLMVDYLSAPIRNGQLHLRDDGRRYETAELALAVRLGLCAALREHLTLGPALIHERVLNLATRLRRGLRDIRGITVRDVGSTLSGLVTFTSETESAAALRDRLAARGIVVNTPIAGQTPLDFAKRDLREVVRASPHVFNTEDEIDRALEVIGGMGVP